MQRSMQAPIFSPFITPPLFLHLSLALSLSQSVITHYLLRRVVIEVIKESSAVSAACCCLMASSCCPSTNAELMTAISSSAARLSTTGGMTGSYTQSHSYIILCVSAHINDSATSASAHSSSTSRAVEKQFFLYFNF